MCRHNHQFPLVSQLSQIVCNISRCDNIKPIGRLIKDHHFRIVYKANCDCCFLLHTRGKFFDLLMCKIFDFKILKQLFFSSFQVFLRNIVKSSEKVKQIICCELRIKLDITCKKSNLFADFLGLFLHFMS